MYYFKKDTNEQVYILQYTGENLAEVIPFLGNKFLSAPGNSRLQFHGTSGIKTIGKNIYLIKNFKTEISTCNSETIKDIYEKDTL